MPILLQEVVLVFALFFDLNILLVESALRELFRTKHGSFPSTLPSGDLSRSARLNQNEDGAFGDSSLGESELFKDTAHEERDKFHSERSSLVDLNDGVDEFFDVPEPSDNDNLDDSWTSDFDSDTYSQVVTTSSMTFNSLGRITNLTFWLAGCRIPASQN